MQDRNHAITGFHGSDGWSSNHVGIYVFQMSESLQNDVTVELWFGTIGNSKIREIKNPNWIEQAHR